MKLINDIETNPPSLLSTILNDSFYGKHKAGWNNHNHNIVWRKLQRTVYIKVTIEVFDQIYGYTDESVKSLAKNIPL